MFRLENHSDLKKLITPWRKRVWHAIGCRWGGRVAQTTPHRVKVRRRRGAASVEPPKEDLCRRSTLSCSLSRLITAYDTTLAFGACEDDNRPRIGDVSPAARMSSLGSDPLLLPPPSQQPPPPPTLLTREEPHYNRSRL